MPISQGGCGDASYSEALIASRLGDEWVNVERPGQRSPDIHSTLLQSPEAVITDSTRSLAATERPGARSLHVESLEAAFHIALQNTRIARLRFDESLKDVDAAQKELAKRRQALTMTERCLQALEQQTAEQSHSSAAIWVGGNSHGEEHEMHLDDRDSVVSDCSVPAEAEEYFQAAREAFIAKERIAELDDEHEQRATVDRIANDEEAEASYQLKRRQFLQASIAAEHDANARKETCLSQGIDPEHFRYRDLSHHSGFFDGADAGDHQGDDITQWFKKTVQDADDQCISDNVMGWLRRDSEL